MTVTNGALLGGVIVLSFSMGVLFVIGGAWLYFHRRKVQQRIAAPTRASVVSTILTDDPFPPPSYRSTSPTCVGSFGGFGTSPNALAEQSFGDILGRDKLDS